MQLRRTAVAVVVDAPAKLNLFFEVLSRRADGYHEIETLMCPIDLYDTIEFREESDGQLTLRCERVTGSVGAGDSEPIQVPEGPDNLALRAVELLRRRTGAERGARLRLIKRIPTSAGLGGGSSDAAAALVAANVGWGIGWPRDRLARLAAELGSDVPFFLAGGAAICRGRGELVEPVADSRVLDFVVVRPPVGLATAEVYRACRAADRPKSLGPALEAFRRADLGALGASLHNRLHEVAESLSPWVRRLGEEFRRAETPGWTMTGSGSACFALCRHARHARRLARRLRSLRLGTVFAVRTCH